MNMSMVLDWMEAYHCRFPQAHVVWFSDDPRRMLEQARRECGRAEQVTLLVSVLPVDQMGKVCAISPWIRTS